MSFSNRQKLVQLARKHDALIVTDDVYDALQWVTSTTISSSSLTKALLPRLVDVDRTLEPTPPMDSFGNAMSNGSFSKIAGPGVRTGWAEATPKFTYGLSQCGSSRSGGAPSQIAATMMSELLISGDMENHIEKVLKPAYKKRYEIMIDAIEKYLIPLGVTVGEVSFEGKNVFGGYFVWLDLPKSVDAVALSETAKETENLIVAPGNIFEVSNDPSVKFDNSLRLCFAWEEEGDLEEGVMRLARVVKAFLDGRGASSKDAGGDGAGLKQDLGEFQ
jgi:DNA-binding transcriptional MocR family regulator